MLAFAKNLNIFLRGWARLQGPFDFFPAKSSAILHGTSAGDLHVPGQQVQLLQSAAAYQQNVSTAL